MLLQNAWPNTWPKVLECFSLPLISIDLTFSFAFSLPLIYMAIEYNKEVLIFVNIYQDNKENVHFIVTHFSVVS
jgi:hypothetical protein